MLFSDMFSQTIGKSALLLAASLAVAVLAKETNSTPGALNPYLEQTVPKPSDAPTLYYNGSGPVPDINLLSPIPVPITPFNRQVKHLSDIPIPV